MKIIIAGDAKRAADLASVLVAQNRKAILISDGFFNSNNSNRKNIRILDNDPADVNLSQHNISLNEEDLVIVTDDDDERLKNIIENIRRQVHPTSIIALSKNTRLASTYKDIMFKLDSTIYRTEFKSLFLRVTNRKRLYAIRNIAGKAGRVVIMIWGNPDPDAIACAYALKYLISKQVQDAIIACTGELKRPENIAMVEMIGIKLQPFSSDLVAKDVSFFTVDAQPSFFELDVPLKFDVVIDHHPKKRRPDCKFTDIRTNYGSTSTILTEYLVDSREPISEDVATALYYGLKIDTDNLSRNAGDPDIWAFQVLKKHADENLLRSIELSQMPQDILDKFGLAIASKKIVKDILFSYLGRIENEDLCVYVADFFMRISGIGWVVVSCKKDNKLVVIFRSDGYRKNVGRLAEKLFSSYGTAGGHKTMARAELDLDTISKETLDKGDRAIENWLIKKLSLRLKPLQKISV